MMDLSRRLCSSKPGVYWLFSPCFVGWNSYPSTNSVLKFAPWICFAEGDATTLSGINQWSPLNESQFCKLCRLWSCASCLHAESTPILVANKWPYHRWSPFAYDFLCPFPGCLHTFVQIFSHVTGRLARFAWLHLGFRRQSRSTVSPNVRLRSIIIFILVVLFGLDWCGLI